MEKVYLDRNENNYGPSSKCIEVARKAPEEYFYGYSKDYKRGVKSALSEKLGIEFGIPEERVLLGYGAEDLLKQVVQVYLKKGDKLLVPSHSWWYYKKIASEVNGVNIEYPIVEGEFEYEYNIEELLKIYNEEKPPVIFISSPNNPTGNSINQDDLIKVLDSTKDSIVVLDEAYWFSSDNKFAAKLVEKYPNLIIIRTFSKLYALAGIRIGYAIIGESLVLLKNLSNRYLGYNRISEQIALAALDSKEYYDDIAKKMAEDRKLYFDELNKLEGFKVYKSNANFVLVKMPKDQMIPLQEHLLSNDISIKFMSEDVLNSHMRISIGTKEQNRRAIELIKNFVNN